MSDDYTPKTVWIGGPPYSLEPEVVTLPPKTRWAWPDCVKVVKQNPGCTTYFIVSKLKGVRDKSVRVMLDNRIAHGNVHKILAPRVKQGGAQYLWYPGPAPKTEKAP